MEEYEQFFDTIKIMTGTLRISIPSKLAESAGFKEGDKIKVLIKKIEKDFDDKDSNKE